jgi:hypothetical protein
MINTRRQASMLAAFVLLCIVTPLSYTQPQIDNVLRQTVSNFTSTDESIDQVLGRLAKDFNVPIGLEKIATVISCSSEDRKLSIKVEQGTVRDALNAIIQADQRYKWEEVDGVINVLPKEDNSRLLETHVSNFQIDEVTWTDARQLIRELPEVKSRLNESGLIERSAILVTGSGENNLPRFSFKLRNTTLRGILNEILKMKGYSFWVIARYGDHNQYISIQAIV